MIFVFIISAVSLVAITSWFLINPLLRKDINHTNSSPEEELTIIYREKAAQLQHQYDNQELDAQEFIIAKEELELALAEELPSKQEKSECESNNKTPIITILVTLPLLSLLLYFTLGRPETLSTLFQQQAAEVPTNQSPEIDPLIKQLAERLEEQPDNVEGWLLLARSYTSLGLLKKAEQAYAQAAERAQDQPIILLDYAESIARANNNVFNGKAIDALNQSLKLDAKSRRGRWLLGIVLLQQGDNTAAIEKWSSMLNEPNISADEQDLLKQFISLAKGEKPNPQQTVGVHVNVSLDVNLTDKIQSTDTLFVYAHAPNGPPMPIAIERHTAAKLPIAVRLDDNDAMIEQMRLSSFEFVTIKARISKSGSATPVSGDLIGVTENVKPREKPVIQIEINQVLP